MSPTVSRIMLSFAMVFASIVGFPLVFLTLELVIGRWYLDEWAYAATPVVFVLAFAVGWLLIWAPQVSWSRQRIGSTIAAAFGSLAGGFATAALLLTVQRYMDALGAILLGMFAWLTLWIALTAIVWRDNVGEQVKRWSRVTVSRVTCRQCGYDMTGLRDPRCPECGASYTLDELVRTTIEARNEVD